MSRLTAAWVVLVMILITVWTVLPTQDIGAQDGDAAQATNDAQATEIAALQTQVNELQTVVAAGEAGAEQVDATGRDNEETLYDTTGQNGGFEDWSLSGDWTLLNDALVNDGSNTDYDFWLAAPFAPSEVADYAVEADIQFLSDDSYAGFGLVVRANVGGGYWAGVKCSQAGIADGGNPFNYCQFLDGSALNTDDSWHSYRVETRGNTITLSIDGLAVAETTDNQFLEGGRIGLFSMSGAQVSVRSFRVIAL